MPKTSKKIKAPKAAVKAAVKTEVKTRIVKPVVISYRLSEEQDKLLQKYMEANPALGVSSTRGLARKLLLDVIKGRVKYVNAKDKEEDLDQL